MAINLVQWNENGTYHEEVLDGTETLNLLLAEDRDIKVIAVTPLA